MEKKPLGIKLPSIISSLILASLFGAGISYSVIYLYHIVLCILIFSFFLVRKTVLYKKELKLPTNYHFFFYYFFLHYFFSLVWSLNKIYTLTYLFYIFNGAFLSLIIIYFVHNTNQQQNLLKKLSFIIIFEIILSLLEIFTSFRWPISPYSQYISYFGRKGTDFNIFNPLVKRILLLMPTGFQWNPNNLAVKMTILIPFFLFLKKRVFKYLGFICCSIIIFATSSRGNIITLVFILFCYFLFYYKALDKKIIICFSIIIIFFILLSIPLVRVKLNYFLALGEASSSYIAAITKQPESVSSISLRGQLIRNGLSALIKSNFIGVGGGASASVQEQNLSLTRGITNMHNFWIELLVEGGGIFFISFLVWYFKIFIELIKIRTMTRREDLKYLASSCSLALAGFLLGAISASTVIYFFPMWILFGFSIATINLFKKELKQRTIPCLENNYESHIQKWKEKF